MAAPTWSDHGGPPALLRSGVADSPCRRGSGGGAEADVLQDPADAVQGRGIVHGQFRLAREAAASASAVGLLAEAHPHLLNRVPAGDRDRVLVEIGASDDSARECLLGAVESLSERGVVGEAVVGDPDRLWEIRHTIPAITERMHPVVS